MVEQQATRQRAGQVPHQFAHEPNGAAKGNEEHIKSSEKVNKEDEYRQVAKDMESLFAHQLLKVMRETAESMSPEKKGQGYNTYMSLFDIELSKLFAERGLGLQDSIVRFMSRMENTGDESSR